MGISEAQNVLEKLTFNFQIFITLRAERDFERATELLVKEGH